MTDPLDILAGLRLADGTPWGRVAVPGQWSDARRILDPSEPPYGFLTRARGYSKTTDLGGIAIAAMLGQLPAASRLYGVAADQGQGRRLLDSISGFVRRTPEIKPLLDIQANRAVAVNGSTLEILPADDAGAWGLEPAFVIVDEIAQWATTRKPRVMWEAVMTAMVKVPGSRLVAMTSAGDPAHWSHKLLEHAKDDPLWWVHEMDGPPPWADPERLEEQRRRRPASVFARLFRNIWTSAEDRLSNVDDVAQCVTLDGPQDPIEGQRYVMGVDLSRVKDYTVVSVMHADWGLDNEGTDIVHRFVLDRLEVWKPSRENEINYGEVEAWILQAAREYRAHVYCDIWQAADMIQGLTAKGVLIEHTNLNTQSNNRMAVTLHTMIRNHRLAIPDDDELIDELVNMRLIETSPNMFKLDHDPDKHNDRGTAMGLALLALAQQSPPRRLRRRAMTHVSRPRNFAPSGSIIGTVGTF